MDFLPYLFSFISKIMNAGNGYFKGKWTIIGNSCLQTDCFKKNRIIFLQNYKEVALQQSNQRWFVKWIKKLLYEYKRRPHGVLLCSDAMLERVRFQNMRCDVWRATCRVGTCTPYVLPNHGTNIKIEFFIYVE